MQSARLKSLFFTGAWLVSLFLCLTISCKTTGPFGTSKSSQKELSIAVDKFNTAMRWQDCQQAATWMTPPLRETFWGCLDDFQSRVRFVDFQIRDLAFNEVQQKGTVFLNYRFYYTDSPVLQSKNMQQHWTFSEDDNTWYLSQFDFRSLMPGR